MTNSTSFLSPYEILPIALKKQKGGWVWGWGGELSYFIMDSTEYTQHTITCIVWKVKKISLSNRHLLPDLAPWLTLKGSNYPYLEQISMVPKMFEALQFDYTFFFTLCHSMLIYMLSESRLTSCHTIVIFLLSESQGKDSRRLFFLSFLKYKHNQNKSNLCAVCIIL